MLNVEMLNVTMPNQTMFGTFSILPVNFILDVDSYKVAHKDEYPEDTAYIFSTVVARKPNKFTDKVVVTGHQMNITKYLAGVRVTYEAIDEAEIEITNAGYDFDRTPWERIIALHGGRLPLEIRCVPEGTVVPVGTAIATIVNTDPELPWLTSYVETPFQRDMWKGTTVASICRAIRVALLEYAEKSGTPLIHVDYCHHNFGDRGADAHEAAVNAGIPHLLQFEGTDCLQANRYIKHYFGETRHHGVSVEASEHSVMCSNSNAEERCDFGGFVKMLDRLETILDKIDKGAKLAPVVSIVIDTYDTYRAVKEFLGTRLKGRIERLGARGGKVVARPDSGNPIEMPIECINMLMDAFGYTVNEKGYKQLPAYIGVLQGDGINQESLRTILNRLDEEKLALGNIVFGMGGGLTHEAGRDEFSFAMKATARCTKDGVWHDLFKDPITDIGKRSLKGRVTTYRTADGRIFSDRIELQEVNKQLVDMLETVFLNGDLLIRYDFEQVIARARA